MWPGFHFCAEVAISDSWGPAGALVVEYGDSALCLATGALYFQPVHCPSLPVRLVCDDLSHASYPSLTLPSGCVGWFCGFWLGYQVVWLGLWGRCLG